MAIRPINVLISFLLYVHVSGDYCQNETNPSIQFCQNGTISGLKVYINGSSVKTKEDLTEKGCICYLEQIGNKDILVDAKDSCLYCGLKLTLGNAALRSSYYASTSHGWKSIVLNDTKVTMTLALDEGTGSLNTAFCIAIHENKPDNPVVLNLTCEDVVTGFSTASSTSPTVKPTSSNNVPDTTKGQSSPASAETDTSLPKTETTKTTEVSAGNTNVTHVTNSAITTNVTQFPKSTDTTITKSTDTTITKSTNTTITTKANNPGEPHTQNEVIIPAAAGGGAGVLVILVILIVVCCLRKKRQDAENPINMKELEKTDAIMTDNVAYGISVDTNTNSVSHIQAHFTGDVYAVVNKEGTSNVFPSAKVPRMQVGETGDVYALVNKESVREIPNTEDSLEKSTKSLLQAKSDRNKVTADITPSTDYADITI